MVVMPIEESFTHHLGDGTVRAGNTSGLCGEERNYVPELMGTASGVVLGNGVAGVHHQVGYASVLAGGCAAQVIDHIGVQVVAHASEFVGEERIAKLEILEQSVQTWMQAVPLLKEALEFLEVG